MKISIFSAFPPFRGGISQFSTKLSESLEKKHELSLITFKKQYPNILFPGKTQYDYLQNNNLKSKINRLVSTFSILSYFKTISFIEKEKPSVFLTNYWMTIFAPFMGFVARKLPKEILKIVIVHNLTPHEKRFLTNYWMTIFAPFMGFVARKLPKEILKIVIVHNLTPHEKRFFDKACNSYLLKSYDGFVALSDYVYNDLKKYVDEKKIIHIPHPTYDQYGKKVNREKACEKLSIDASKHTFLFFGIIRKYKGLDLLIQAFDRLDDSFQLIIAGEVYGKDDEIVRLINNNKNKDRILFHNQFIPDDEISTYFSASNYLVLPYRSGTQSGVLAIANHFNLPIIATDIGGLAEVLNFNTDLIIEFPQITAIEQTLILSKEKSTGFSKNEFVASKSTTWDSFSSKLEEFALSLKK